ncbi:unnamed protein product [Rangifer tarandus platyrhynchus]|uniref:V-type proton ATPase subunit D n=1 Tax=Rangifer tarandus platyrhynchus TaxID=3082113 RepID=A0ABN9A478_RANTA|nr:unnamed protein product [Rangifer tarandus platyrhynchus]
MSGKDEIEIFPSRMAQTVMKAQLKGAQTGPNLLKKKSDALTLQFRQILKKIIETKMMMGEVMREAAFSLAEAKLTAGDFSTTVSQNVNKAQVKIGAKKDNVAGVTLPVFEHYHEGTDNYELTGLARELDEREQEEFYRLKKIQEKKKILKEKSDKDLEQQRAAREVMEPANLLAEEKDEDLLFE